MAFVMNFLTDKFHSFEQYLHILQPWRDRAKGSHRVLLAIVFVTNLVDNLLLTSVGKLLSFDSFESGVVGLIYI